MRKYILIFSDEVDDSADRLIEWLCYYKLAYIRITEKSRISIVRMNVNDLEDYEFIVNSRYKLIKRNIQAVWFRKSYFTYDDFFVNPQIRKAVCQFLEMELQAFKEYFFDVLRRTNRSVGCYKSICPNKLNQLWCAHSVGLKIPQTEILSKYSKRRLNGNRLSKPIQDLISFEYGGSHYSTLPFIINGEKLTEFPSLVQEYVEKLFELRIFFL